MFIVTAKFSKKRALAIVLAIAVFLCAIVILAGRRDQYPEGDLNAIDRRIETSHDLVAFLENLGWQIIPEPIEVQEILIPREWGDIYEAYNALQLEAGFDLSAYRGRPAVRHTYEVLNHPGQSEGVVADVLVANGRVIGGAIQSIYIDGFIHGLFPRQEGL